MPELPETETIARDLHELVCGARIVSVAVPRPDVLREHDAASFDASLAGGTIVRAWRRAKLIILDVRLDVALDGVRSPTSGDAPDTADWHIVVQPRFTGGLVVDDGTMADAERAYVCVSLALADARRVHYRDVRRLGTVALMSPARFAEYEAMLGVEPLDPRLGDAEFSALVRSSRLSIKSWLMDQRRIAGIGNIYANEALWRARLDPSREARTLSPVEATRLLGCVRDVLTASIAARGTSFRDYRDARGERGGFVAQLAAYGRGGEPCHACTRRLVETHAIDGRTTVFCAHCQR